MQSLKKIHAWAQMKVPLSEFTVIITILGNTGVTHSVTLHSLNSMEWVTTGLLSMH